MKCCTHLRETVQVIADPFDAQCPSRHVLDRIGDRWSVLVILTLADGTKRYGEVAAAIDGVSQKMLTQTLRGLERDGLVHRQVYAEVPPRVEYALTDLGRSLLGAVGMLHDWATANIDDVLAARSAYDAR